jgi:four helix bundle protein
MNNRQLKSFKDLTVWQKAADLAVLVYKITEKFPRSELYGIANQMRRAIISVSSNLAEGFKRIHEKEKLQFYNVAYSSISELESQIEISKRLGFLSENDYQDLMPIVVEISKMINGLIKSLNSKSYILNSKNGFTMVELLVAMSLFIIFVVISSGSFIRALRIQRAIVALIAANDNASLSIEQMAREIRTGTDFSSANSNLTFTNAKSIQVTYQLNSETMTIERGEDGSNFKPITATNVKINKLNFYLRGHQAGDGFPPRITVVLNAAPNIPTIQNISTNFQTTVSARLLDT